MFEIDKETTPVSMNVGTAPPQVRPTSAELVCGLFAEFFRGRQPDYQ